MNHFIITGTSRGIGHQIAKILLREGHAVHGISRGGSTPLDGYEKYSHYNYDLNDVLGIELLMKRIFDTIQHNSGEMLCLINNAAMLEPLKSIDKCNTEELTANIHISLVAPMVLTSSFIRYASQSKTRRKIINISSGSGTYPAPDMSAYCTAKAGINMFTQCIGSEQLHLTEPVEIIAVDPGMVDTDMQRAARAKHEEEFKMAKFFDQAFQAGQLSSVEQFGKFLFEVIHKEFVSGTIVKYTKE